MRGMALTETEQHMVKSLLEKVGMTEYEVFVNAPEGGNLPGSQYAGEISAFSGWVVTKDHISDCWFDWYEGGYTLGHEDGFWEETSLEELKNDQRLCKAIYERAHTCPRRFP